jgi:hypothetical protein
MADFCKMHLLSDEPSKTDAFGGHERVAEAVARLIREEQGGKAIALTGSWGSGKSTVVELIRNKLVPGKGDASGEHCVLVFDTWAHQGDPLRRSFLEKLRECAVKATWVQKDKFRAEFEQLSRRREDNTITTIPILTGYGKIGAVLIYLVPLGLAMIVGSVRPLWLGWVLVLLPLAASTLFWLFNRKRESLGLLFSRVRETVRSTTLRTPDPTSIEFVDLFEKVLNQALKKSTRKLVIVMDNLDRLQPDEALQVWATMRTFFDSGRECQDWSKRLWLIVPFDRDGISRLWEREKTQSSDASTPPKSTTANGANGDKANAHKAVTPAHMGLAPDFLNKTFQVVFEVPPPVLSDWNRFCEKQLRDAFFNESEHPENDLLTVSLLFGDLRENYDEPVTPREIKLFANRLVTVHLQWGHKIPIATQAAYILYSRRIRESPETLGKLEFLDAQSLNLLNDPNYQKNLAALHFGVEPDKAMQVLIGRKVEGALRGGDGEAITGLISVQGFRDVCSSIVSRNLKGWVAVEPQSIALAALALDAVPEQSVGHNTWAQLLGAATDIESWQGGSAAWDQRLGTVADIESWRELSEKVGRGLSVLLRRCEDSSRIKFATAILQRVSKASPSAKGEGDKVTSYGKWAAAWCACVLPVLRQIEDEGPPKVIEDNLKVPGAANIYLSVMSAAVGANSDKIVEYLVPAALPSDVVQELTNHYNPGKLDENWAETIELMTKVHRARWNWKPLIDILGPQTHAAGSGSVEQITRSLTPLVYLAMVPNNYARASLTQLASSGVLMNALAWWSNNSKVAALCIFAFLECTQEEVPPPISQESAAAAGELAALVAKWNRTPELLERASAGPNAKVLVCTVVREIAKREDARELLDASTVIDHYALLRGALSEESLAALGDKLVKQGSLVAEVTKHPFSVELADLYVHVLETDAGGTDENFAKFLIDSLKEVNKEAWKQELSAEGPLLRLLAALRTHGRSPDLGPPFEDALLGEANELIQAGESSPRDAKKSKCLIEALTPDNRKVLLLQLRDLILGNHAKTVAPLLTLYGNWLLTTSDLQTKAEELVAGLFTSIVERDDRGEAEWLLKAVERPAIFNNCGGPSRRVFASRVGRRVNDSPEDDELRGIYEEIKNRLEDST